MTDQLYFSNFSDEQILAHPDIKQRILMMTGQVKDKKLELTKEQEKQIAHDYGVMFRSLIVINWCKGGTLGMAQQKSLEQMSSFVKTKSNPEHPMNKYLHALDNQHRREFSEYIMKNKYSEETVGINSELAQRWAKIATGNFQKAFKRMNEMYKQYMPQKQAEDKTKQVENEKQNAYKKMFLFLQMRQMSDERAA